MLAHRQDSGAPRSGDENINVSLTIIAAMFTRHERCSVLVQGAFRWERGTPYVG